MQEKAICYKFASRSRPEKFFKALENIATLSTHERYFIIASFDEDDPHMNNEVVRKRLLSTSRVFYWFGNSRNKIDAINRDMDRVMPHWDVLITMSDDMRFAQKGFDTAIVEDLFGAYPDGDACIQYWDQGKETRDLMTMSIMGRKYYERFGYIYFPGYESVWCDNEATQVAERLNRLIRSPRTIISHDHPANGIGESDEQYRRTESPEVHNRDAKLFYERHAQHFFLDREGTPLLSILVCTLPERKEMLSDLRTSLYNQLGYIEPGTVEYHQDDDATLSVGAKRQALLLKATGKFIVFIDDDDHIEPIYLSSIVKAIIKEPSVACIGIEGWMTTNGADRKEWKISKTFGTWYEKDNVYYRTPNHISPVRREIALLVGGFKDMKFGEDADYSIRILPFLWAETMVEKQLYHYDFKHK